MINTKRVKKRSIKYSVFFSFIVTVLISAGISIEKYLSVFNINFYFFILFFVVFFLLSMCLLHLLPFIINNLEKSQFLNEFDSCFFNRNKCFRNCMLFILICYIPIIITFFPGIIANDVLYHANFFINHDYIEIHPVFYNLIVYLTLLFGLKIKSTTISIYLYTLIQILIMISIFSYCICVMSKYKIYPFFKVLTLLYFALHPVNHVLCMSMDKDTLFSGFCLLFIVNMIETMYDKQNKRIHIGSAVVSAILMQLMRLNAFFAFILMFVLLCLFLKNRKKICAILLIPICFYLSFGIVKDYFKIKKPTIASYIAIPLQQMGYVRMIEDSKITNEEKNDFRNIVSKQNEFKYNPYDVGSLKFDKKSGEQSMLHSDFIEHSIKENPWRFIKLYLKWGKSYPKDYINAFTLNTYLYWYPFGKWSKADIFSKIYLYTRNNWNDIFGIPIKRYFLIPSIDKMYFSIFHNNSYEKNPFAFAFFSIGINSFMIFFGFFVLFYRKKYRLILSFLIIPSLFLTVLFGPCCLLRYVYQNFLILPLILSFCFSNFKENPKIQNFGIIEENKNI